MIFIPSFKKKSWLVAPLLFLVACQNQNTQEQASYFVAYINSYHKGYGSSDDVMEGIAETLNAKNIDGKPVKWQTYYLDSKRSPAEADIQDKVSMILDSLEKAVPDVVIASDDNAVKHLVVPHLKGSDIPVVFCGVNWSAEPYGLPVENITGMLEILPLAETLRAVEARFSPLRRLTVLSENTTSELKNRVHLMAICKELDLETDFALVDDFEAWKAAFLEAQQQSDIVFIPTNGAVRNWEHEAAVSFVHHHLRKPVISCDDFMMPYAVFGLTKVAKEQGEWAANAALNILEGTKPSEIKVTSNSEYQVWINEKMAAKIGFTLSDSLRAAANIL